MTKPQHFDEIRLSAGDFYSLAKKNPRFFLGLMQEIDFEICLFLEASETPVRPLHLLETANV